MSERARRVLVVVTHPKAESLTRAAFARVITGLTASGHEIRVLDLDEEGFDPRLSLEEKRSFVPTAEGTSAIPPDLAHHVQALLWAERLVLVYPTWFGGPPARLKGWFDRVWRLGVAYDLPKRGTRPRGKLKNIRSLHVVTSHGSSSKVNRLQGNGGRLMLFRSIRGLCHRFCRVSWTAIYSVDQASTAELEGWLGEVEDTFAPAREATPLDSEQAGP